MHLKYKNLFFFTAILSSLILSGPVYAEVDEILDASEEIDEAPGYEDPKDSQREWALSLGAVVGGDDEGNHIVSMWDIVGDSYGCVRGTLEA